MALSFFKIVGDTVAHFRPAACAVSKAREHTAFLHLGTVVLLPSELLHLIKDFLLDAIRVHMAKYHLIFKQSNPLFLIPDGLIVGLVISGAADVFLPFQNVNNIPIIREYFLYLAC